MVAENSTFDFSQFIFSHSDRLSECKSSLASAEKKVLQRMGKQPRFGGCGRARLPEMLK